MYENQSCGLRLVHQLGGWVGVGGEGGGEGGGGGGEADDCLSVPSTPMTDPPTTPTLTSMSRPRMSLGSTSPCTESQSTSFTLRTIYDIPIVITDRRILLPALPTMLPPPSTRLMMWDLAPIARSAVPLRLLMPTKATTATF